MAACTSTSSLLGRRLLLLSRRFLSSPLRPFSTTSSPSSHSAPGFDAEPDPEQPPADQTTADQTPSNKPPNTNRPLENGLDQGIYKVI
jgi:single-strand DNA-binding protein